MKKNQKPPPPPPPDFLRILVTGGAGFIGAALCQRLLERGDEVHVVDNLNDYYEVRLKQARLDGLTEHARLIFHKLDIVDRDAMRALFQQHNFDIVVNLAAQAGVRHSIENPAAYIDSNLVGFGNILEGCRNSSVKHLVYASSSSVYGGNSKLPFSENDPVEKPFSLYAATKKSNELMAQTYSHLYDLTATGLRFFTVYGPWGRPDMAFFKFTRLMLAGHTIPVYNHGELVRDFTYIDDIVEGVMRVVDAPLDPADRHRVYNLGNGSQVQLMDYIHALEDALGVKAEYRMLPMQPGDVHATCADMRKMENDFDFLPVTDIATGLKNFARWYRSYYKVN